MIINGIKCNTQTEAVLQYLKTGKPLDQAKAYELIGTQRLGAIIYNLRHKVGYHIVNIKSKGFNRFGNDTNYTKYALVNTGEEITRIEEGLDHKG